MISSILHGLLSALCVTVALAMAETSRTPQFWSLRTAAWVVILLGATAFLQWLYTRRQESSKLAHYDGVAELMIHLHAPVVSDRPSRWAFRGALSWGLCGLGLPFGPEGVAAELSQAVGMQTRSRANQWSDLRRRTDAAQAISAGMSAAFGAPFAAVLLPAELSIGGRVISSVLASLSAFVGVQYFSLYLGQFGIPTLSFHERLSRFFAFHLMDLREWGAALLLGSLVLVLSMIFLLGLRQIRKSIQHWSANRAWLATAMSCGLLVSIVLLGPASLGSLPHFFEMAVRNELSLPLMVALSSSLFLTLCAIYAGVGSLGMWWPTFLLGVLSSLLVLRGLTNLGWPPAHSEASLALLGAVVWCAVWFQAPVTFAVLAFEVSGNGALMLPALFLGWLAVMACKKGGTVSWIQASLDSKGFPIRGGRSVEVMDSLPASEAMVRDFGTVLQNDSAFRCREVLRSCKYPFLAVVHPSGEFVGLLTAVMVDQGVRAQEELVRAGEDLPPRLTELIEAKDLLFRAEGLSGASVKTVLSSTPLSQVAVEFDGQPCVPVLSEDRRPLGLVFPHDVRHAYDREIARLSFMVQAGMA